LEVIPTQAPSSTTSSSSTTTSSTSTTPTTTSTPPPPTTDTPTPTPTPAPTTQDPVPAATTPAPAAVSSAAAPASSPAQTIDPNAAVPSDYAGVALYHHNAHRANHSATTATYDATLAGYAAQVAASCKFAHDLYVPHSSFDTTLTASRSPGGGGYGQNIAAAGASDASSVSDATSVAQAITNMWYYGEVNSYTYYGQDNPDMSNFEAWGHFTQVVWDVSTQIGCASQLCPTDTAIAGMPSWFTVCNYKSAGKYSHD
jgi:uncharacterized protein YkwD